MVQNEIVCFSANKGPAPLPNKTNPTLPQGCFLGTVCAINLNCTRGSCQRVKSDTKAESKSSRRYQAIMSRAPPPN